MATPIPKNEAPLDAFTAAAATGGSIVRMSGDGLRARGITSDSRAVTHGSTFVALKGERVDGHDYLELAAKSGAALIICERGRGPASLPSAVGDLGPDIVEVDDTLAAWGALAKAHLRAWRRNAKGGDLHRVVALTGSAGKTTTKELTAAILGNSACGHATFGNLNNLVGVPAVAFGVTSMDRWCVIEAGMSVRGEIAAISDIVEPEVALVLNATLAHAGGVGGQRADVAREKGALFAGLSATGIAIANADDRAVMGQLARTCARDVRTFGEKKDAVYQLVSRRPRADGKVGSIVEIATHAGNAVLNLPIPGAAAAIDLVAAWAAAEATLGMHIWAESVQAALDSLAAIDGRMRVERFTNGPIVIDDTYNANPASMANAIDTLREMSADLKRRAVVVVGEMRELGDVTVEEHRRVGERLAAAGVALVIGCGGATEETLRAFHELAPSADAVSNPDAEAAARAVCERAKPDDVILVKGSRGAKTEQAVEALRLKFAQSAHL